LIQFQFSGFKGWADWILRLFELKVWTVGAMDFFLICIKIIFIYVSNYHKNIWVVTSLHLKIWPVEWNVGNLFLYNSIKKLNSYGETYFEYDFIYLAGSKIFARIARLTISVNFGIIKNLSWQSNITFEKLILDTDQGILSKMP
jgi:hypothetical protein